MSRRRHTKNGRRDILPLHPVVAEAMRLWTVMEKLGPDDPLFPLRTATGNYRRTSKMMQRDLKAAREKWIGDQPDWKTTRERIEAVGGDLIHIHTSGHAFVEDIQKLVKQIAPKKTIPMHTFEPEALGKCFENVVTNLHR